ncbi:hypothetical protein WJX72_011000 [[Myrmecia] bisecta]|uniref:Uncharacterized protein n=1 Tax=[Myrmecia] bisecta TaxID=41462 RepID=A0AAW1Q6C8_9CHLO
MEIVRFPHITAFLSDHCNYCILRSHSIRFLRIITGPTNFRLNSKSNQDEVTRTNRVCQKTFQISHRPAWIFAG